jgi:hypothetical protein
MTRAGRIIVVECPPFLRESVAREWQEPRALKINQ